MKTYLFNILSSFSKWSDEKDIETSVKNILCNRKWRLLNEDNVLEYYVFQTDGILKNVCNGNVTLGTWKYDFVLKALEIHMGESVEMFETANFMNLVMVMKKVGGLESAIFLDDATLEMKQICSIDSLNTFLENKEKRRQQVAKQKEYENQSIPFTVFTLGFLLLILLLVVFITK